MKSATVGPIGQPLPLNTVVPITSATLPSVADMLIEVFVASAVGMAAPFVVPPARLIRKYCPGVRVTEVRSSLLALEKLPALEAYCTE